MRKYTVSIMTETVEEKFGAKKITRYLIKQKNKTMKDMNETSS
jgi:hypothetical protein